MSLVPDDPLPAELRAPDDARELDEDVKALRREQRAARRARLRSRRRTGPGLPVLALTALSVACSLALVQLFAGRGRLKEFVGPAPLRSAPQELTGKSGGLLPDVAVTDRASSVDVRTLRPAVLMLVRPECDCLSRVRHVVSQTARHPVRVYLIGDRPQMQQLAAGAGGSASPITDPSGTLARLYLHAAPAALVFVRADGLVSEIIDGVATSLRLDAPIGRMLLPSAS